MPCGPPHDRSAEKSYARGCHDRQVWLALEDVEEAEELVRRRREVGVVVAHDRRSQLEGADEAEADGLRLADVTRKTEDLDSARGVLEGRQEAPSVVSRPVIDEEEPDALRSHQRSETLEIQPLRFVVTGDDNDRESLHRGPDAGWDIGRFHNVQ